MALRMQQQVYMKMIRTPIVNDYIKTTTSEFVNGPWKGKIVREDVVTGMYLVAWSYAGGLSTDICTWVFPRGIKVTKRLKNYKK